MLPHTVCSRCCMKLSSLAASSISLLPELLRTLLVPDIRRTKVANICCGHSAGWRQRKRTDDLSVLQSSVPSSSHSIRRLLFAGTNESRRTSTIKCVFTLPLKLYSTSVGLTSSIFTACRQLRVLGRECSRRPSAVAQQSDQLPYRAKSHPLTRRQSKLRPWQI